MQVSSPSSTARSLTRATGFSFDVYYPGTVRAHGRHALDVPKLCTFFEENVPKFVPGGPRKFERVMLCSASDARKTCRFRHMSPPKSSIAAEQRLASLYFCSSQLHGFCIMKVSSIFIPSSLQ